MSPSSSELPASPTQTLGPLDLSLSTPVLLLLLLVRLDPLEEVVVAVVVLVVLLVVLVVVGVEVGAGRDTAAQGNIAGVERKALVLPGVPRFGDGWG